MEKGTNFNTNNVLDYIGPLKLQEIEKYIQKITKDEYMTFQSSEEIRNYLEAFSNEYLEKLSQEEIESIFLYTSYHFRNVNAVLRNNWNYEVNGKLTEETRKENWLMAETIRKALLKVPRLPFPIKAYRGVTVDAFKNYQINNLEELKLLQGRYLYEEGFTSTTLLREQSFFANKTHWGSPANIEIEYFIPQSDDGVLLTSSMSASSNQQEFLVNSSSVFKVLNVDVDLEKGIAKMQVVLIPYSIWNAKDYEVEKQSVEGRQR